jgi:hypothetical protein
VLAKTSSSLTKKTRRLFAHFFGRKHFSNSQHRSQIPLPIGALAVLCIDLGTDLLPAISLSYEEEEIRYGTMRRGPRNPLSEGLLDERLLFLSCGQVPILPKLTKRFTRNTKFGRATQNCVARHKIWSYDTN